jgi:hypothetical protein
MNKFKYLDSKGEHVVGGKLTGWVHTDMVRQGKCPRCGSDAGYHCETESGKKVWPPHSDRVPAGYISSWLSLTKPSEIIR